MQGRSPKRLVLLGGGHAHVHVLQDMARAPLPDTQVVLITPFARQMYSGMVPGLVAGHYGVDQCAIALPPLAAAAGVAMVDGAATALDAAARVLTLADGSVAEYDLLSIDTGSVMDRDAIPGAREHGLFVRPIEHFVKLLGPLFDLAAKRVLDVVVIGGGAAGVELALALQFRLGGRGEEMARVALVTGGAAPLEGYPEGVKRRALRAMRDRRIAVFAEPCQAIEAGHVVLANGARLSCDAPVLAIGSSAPSWLVGSGLALDARGFISTGASLQSVSHSDVFAVGDVASRLDAPHPRSGVYAVRAGPPLAANLRAVLGGSKPLPHQPPVRTLNLISCGEKHAIVSWGGWSAEGGWAWWWKDRIDRAFIDKYSKPGPAATRVTPAA